ncbi:MAG: hypothetical protein FJY92_06865 [Candidatus Hydrogenedentes bacterium]|nr:hypothetical protein [Candidatus Hydrogenedentota bacterium]
MISGIVSLVVGLIGTVVAIIVGTVGSVVGLIVAIVVGIIVPLIILAVPLFLIMAVVWLLGLPSARRARRCEPDDTRIMQDINRGLARMENRLNSLETIMMDDDARTQSVR